MYGPHYVVAQAIAQNLHRGNSLMAEQEAAQARGWIADQLDQGRQFDMAKTKRREAGVAHAIIEPIHDAMFGGRVRVARQPGRERYHYRPQSQLTNPKNPGENARILSNV